MLRRCMQSSKRSCTLVCSRRRAPQVDICTRLYQKDSSREGFDGASYFRGLVAASVLVAASTEESPKEPPSPDLLDHWDSLYDTGQLDELVRQLKPFQDLDLAEVLWRRARAEWTWNKGIRFATSGYQKRRLDDSFVMVNRALELDSGNSNVYLCKAILIKAQCQLSGSPKQQFAGMEDMKHYLERALEMDPKNATAAQLLGTWHFEVAQIGWVQRKLFSVMWEVPEGSYQEALQYVSMALETQPSIRNLLLVAKIYNGMGEADKAKNYMKLALERPVNTADDLEASDEARLFKGKLR